jgi:hypothetical protein
MFSIYVSNTLRSTAPSADAVAGLRAFVGKLCCSECAAEQLADFEAGSI